MFTCFELAAVIAAERDYVQLIFNLNILREIIRAANDPSVFTITKKAPTRAFSWLKAPTSAFTFKTLLRH